MCIPDKCSPGYKPTADQQSCEKCPRGTYQPQPDQTDCLPCVGAKMDTRTDGAVLQSQCESETFAYSCFLHVVQHTYWFAFFWLFYTHLFSSDLCIFSCILLTSPYSLVSLSLTSILGCLFLIFPYSVVVFWLVHILFFSDLPVLSCLLLLVHTKLSLFDLFIITDLSILSCFRLVHSQFLPCLYQV